MQYDSDSNTWRPSILKVGMKLKSKIHGTEFILDQEQIDYLEDSHCGEWWNLFEIISE